MTGIDSEREENREMDMMRYEESGIDERIIRAVREMGYETMTPIQEQAIPLLMEGRDVIGQAQTGTGKTAAFGIPLLQKIDPDDRSLQAVVLCPTRELAIQATEEMHKFSKYMHGIKMAPIYGGQDISRQIKALKGGVQIIVGTPGRVMDHMRRHTLKMDSVKTVVLDEADEMLDMGFREDMETILKEIPEEHQTALFSATMPKPILEITSTYQKDAVLVKVAAEELTIPLVKQYYFVVKSIYKEEVICRLLEVHGLKRSIIFCNTKRMVDELTENLKARGYQAEGLHGDLTQKQRDFVMGRFKSGALEILIATDVAARGIDVYDVEAVFNYDIPQEAEYYVHRIGRTGRAGKEGMSFTFAYGRDLYRIRNIERICKTRMTEEKVPSVGEVTRIKADKVMREASGIMETARLDRLTQLLEEYVADRGEDPMRFAAALLKMHMGNEIQEIVVEEPRKSREENAFSESGRDRGRERRGAGESGKNRGRKEQRGGSGRRKLGVWEYGPERGKESRPARGAAKGAGKFRRGEAGGRRGDERGAERLSRRKSGFEKPKDVRRNGREKR